MDEKHLVETTVRETKIFDGHILHVQVDDILLPDGGPAIREVIRHIGAVGIVPLTDDGQVIMERQYRYPVASVLTEIPAGKMDSPDEPPLEAAKRELREETGFEAEEWIPLGTMIPAAAYCDEVLHLYLARGLHVGAQALDQDEFLDVLTIPLAALIQDILTGKITDAKTQTALMKTWLLLKNEE